MQHEVLVLIDDFKCGRPIGQTPAAETLSEAGKEIQVGKPQLFG